MILTYKKRRNSQNSLLVLLAFFVLLNSGTSWSRKLNLTYLISDGTPVDGHSLGKFVASIQLRSHQKPTFGWYHFCGGTIISSKKILTAAHCLIKRPGILYKPCEIVVVVGLRHRFNRTSQTQVKNVALVKAHKAFGRDNTYFADVGFLILKKEIIFNDHVAKIDIRNSSSHHINEICTVIGWGKLFDYGPTSDRILFADVEISRIRSCKKKYGSMLTPGMLCAAAPEDLSRDSCAGDSGGPLICGELVVGIVSWGVGCGYENLPGVYTDVYYFKDWISKALCLRRANYLIAIVLLNFL